MEIKNRRSVLWPGHGVRGCSSCRGILLSDAFVCCVLSRCRIELCGREDTSTKTYEGKLGTEGEGQEIT